MTGGGSWTVRTADRCRVSAGRRGATMPIFRVPIHFGYLLYLAGISESVARAYLATGLRLFQLFRVRPSLLFHPLERLDGRSVAALRSSPGADIRNEGTLDVLSRYVLALTGPFDLASMSSHPEAQTARPSNLAAWLLGGSASACGQRDLQRGLVHRYRHYRGNQSPGDRRSKSRNSPDSMSNSYSSRAPTTRGATPSQKALGSTAR